MGQHRPGQANIEATVGNHLPNPLRSPFFEDHGEARVTPPELLYNSAQKYLSRRTDIAEPEFPFLAGRGALDAADGFVEALQEDPCPVLYSVVFGP